MKRNTTLILLLLCFLLGCYQTNEENKSKKKERIYLRDEMSLQSGLTLFNQHCASCHNFSESDIGPNLAGITSEVEKEWLVSFINDPAAMIDGGDERAKKQFEKYKLYMPPFPSIQGEDLEHLLGFIHKFSEGEEKNLSQNNRPGGLLNPIAEKIPTSELTLVLDEFITVPPSAETDPKARINKLLAIENDRLFIHDLQGKLYEIEDGETHEYLNIASEFPDFINNPGHGTGLGSFAFHPEFSQNGLFYTTHTEPPHSQPADFPLDDTVKISLQWVVMEWQTKDPSAKTFSGSNRELLRMDMISVGHGVQEITFNPLAQKADSDYGLLYIAIGDGGLAIRGYSSFCDNLGKIWGKIIRIDPLGNNSANGKYGIPEDNPFVGTPDALDEIWASGFRNPHRISWDLTGSEKMFISNIGQHSVEELNLGIKGADYGWPKREGTFIFDVNANPELVYPLTEGEDEFTYPAIQYDHDEGNAISGGFAYAGSKVPELKGKYIFGDIARGTLFYSEIDEIVNGKQAPVYRFQLEFKGELTDLVTIAESRRVQLRLGLDGDGELYVFTKSNGVVYKVIEVKSIPIIP